MPGGAELLQAVDFALNGSVFALAPQPFDDSRTAIRIGDMRLPLAPDGGHKLRLDTI